MGRGHPRWVGGSRRGRVPGPRALSFRPTYPGLWQLRAREIVRERGFGWKDAAVSFFLTRPKRTWWALVDFDVRQMVRYDIVIVYNGFHPLMLLSDELKSLAWVQINIMAWCQRHLGSSEEHLRLWLSSEAMSWSLFFVVIVGRHKHKFLVLVSLLVSDKLAHKPVF